MLRHSVRLIMRQSNRLYCSSCKQKTQDQPRNLSADDIMTKSANKATRFVYLRTLPLVKQSELHGHIETVAASIEKMTKNLCEKHVATVTDDRSAVHLHTASLAIATHRVLSSHIKNQIRLSNIIRAGFGAVLLDDPAKPDEAIQLQNSEKRRPDFWIVRAALWFSFNRMAAVRKMTANMVRDFGSQFQTESHDQTEGQAEQHELIVSKLCLSLSLRGTEGRSPSPLHDKLLAVSYRDYLMSMHLILPPNMLSLLREVLLQHSMSRRGSTSPYQDLLCS